jgi:hypothetical protein
MNDELSEERSRVKFEAGNDEFRKSPSLQGAGFRVSGLLLIRCSDFSLTKAGHFIFEMKKHA